MLSFSANSRPQTQGPPTKQFDYFVIQNNPVKHTNPPRIPNPKPKSIVKTLNSKPKPNHNATSSSLNRHDNKQFSYQGTQPKLFDQRLKRGELAAEQRRIQNQLRKNNNQIIHQDQFSHIPTKVQTDVVNNQKNRIDNTKKRSMDKSQKQMNHLHKLIEKQKKEKIVNDHEFLQKEKALNAQLKKLKMIENQIKKVRNPNHPVPIENSFNSVNTNNRLSYYPQPEGTKQIRNNEHYIDGEEQKQRKKKQLAVLMGRRQKLQKYQNPLKYTPTLIPLISKASYRLISTHISGITQLLIDDILLQQVLLLEQIEQKQRQKQDKRKQKMILQDYVNQVGQMVRDNDLIENRIGNYTKLDFFQWHQKPQSYNLEQSTKKQQYQTYDTLTLYLVNQMKMQIYKNKDKFQKFTKYRDQYNKGNLKMFGDATQQLIEQIINDMVQELDKGSSQFVETIFKHQFK